MYIISGKELYKLSASILILQVDMYSLANKAKLVIVEKQVELQKVKAYTAEIAKDFRFKI